MSDYRLGMRIEDATDDAGNTFSCLVDTRTGRRYSIQSFDMGQKEYPVHYMQEFLQFRVPRKWQVSMGLVEVPEPPEPPEPKRTVTTQYGLRRPK